MRDQHHMWDESHKKRQLKAYSSNQTSFAEEVNKIVPKSCSILELGCGEGNDSWYFAEQGHNLVATDFSETVIKGNQQNLVRKGLEFTVVDISRPLNYPDNSFDVVYARLSLHYFTDKDTQKIFSEIARVIKPRGYLCFMCKSIDDSLYGQGLQIEKDMYELHGHVRHFFSIEYAKSLLSTNNLKPVLLENGKDKLYERQSAFIKVVAQK